jgi:hypothetical protein
MIGFGQLTYVPDDAFEAYLEANNMGNGIANDDYVTTANIDTVTLLEVGDDGGGGGGIYDLSGIEDFTNLQYLSCGGDFILHTLNVSNNINLNTLICSVGALTYLDISQNVNLKYLNCQDNEIICIDISNNPLLSYLDCRNNNLSQLNLRNGNWQGMWVEADVSNSNLSCVEVDNISYASSNWIFNSFTTISTNCNYTNPCNTSTSIQEHTTNKELLKVTDLLGRETKQTNQPLFYIYDDGTVEKRIVIE